MPEVDRIVEHTRRSRFERTIPDDPTKLKFPKCVVGRRLVVRSPKICGGHMVGTWRNFPIRIKSLLPYKYRTTKVFSVTRDRAAR